MFWSILLCSALSVAPPGTLSILLSALFSVPCALVYVPRAPFHSLFYVLRQVHQIGDEDLQGDHGDSGISAKKVSGLSGARLSVV